MYLIIQVPCLDEAPTLPDVINEIPRNIPGITRIELLVIDDGSKDETSKIAKELGVHHVIRHAQTRGLAYSFKAGLTFALDSGADILVNTDGDNQYPSKYITDIVLPIVQQEADIVIGDRGTMKVKHFSLVKRVFQRLGTIFTVLLSGEKNIKDAVSGFRAYSRTAMKELNVTSNFSYVLDTAVQARQKRLRVISVPITTNPPTRPSRLFNNIRQHMWRSGTEIFKVFAFYKPMRLFMGLGIVVFAIGSIPVIRFLYYYLMGNSSGKIQSLVIGSIILSVSFNLFALGIIGELLSKNRYLTEEILMKLKEREYKKKKNGNS